MILILAKIIAIITALFVLAKTTHDFRKRKETLFMFIFWYCLWWGVIIITLFPKLIDLIFGAGRSGVNTFMGLVIVFLLYLNYRFYLKADRTERAVHYLIGELAIGPTNKKK